MNFANSSGQLVDSLRQLQNRLSHIQDVDSVHVSPAMTSAAVLLDDPMKTAQLKAFIGANPTKSGSMGW